MKYLGRIAIIVLIVAIFLLMALALYLTAIAAGIHMVRGEWFIALFAVFVGSMVAAFLLFAGLAAIEYLKTLK